MPNWVEQDLHVVGPREEIDRFVKSGFVRRRRRLGDDVLDFMRLCPLGRREKPETYTHATGVVRHHFRTHTQALFAIATTWDYPAEFYARLAKHWPALSFACTVNEDAGGFGGMLTVLGGVYTNLVRDYDVNYVRRAHARQIRALLKGWGAFVTDERPWHVAPSPPGDERYLRVDAHFDDDFWFYFKTRDEMRAFERARARRRTGPPTARTARVKGPGPVI